VTISRQDIALPIHLLQPVNFENKLYLTLESIGQAPTKSVKITHSFPYAPVTASVFAKWQKVHSGILCAAFCIPLLLSQCFVT
jgi:hypothetical protein